MERTLEGFNKGMDRYDPGSSAAAAGTVIWNESQKPVIKESSKTPAATHQ